MPNRERNTGLIGTIALIALSIGGQIISNVSKKSKAKSFCNNFSITIKLIEERSSYDSFCDNYYGKFKRLFNDIFQSNLEINEIKKIFKSNKDTLKIEYKKEEKSNLISSKHLIIDWLVDLSQKQKCKDDFYLRILTSGICTLFLFNDSDLDILRKAVGANNV